MKVIIRFILSNQNKINMTHRIKINAEYYSKKSNIITTYNIDYYLNNILICYLIIKSNIFCSKI
jgi:hypothetical protein